MQQDPGSALGELVRAAGPEGLDDARRVRAMLRDAAPEARLEVSLLVAAVEEGVGQRLARSSGGLLGGEIERLSGDLVARRGLSPGNADWAVRTLSWAVGRSPRPAPLVVEAGGPGRGHPDNGPGRVVTHPGGWEPPRSDPGGLPGSWVIDGPVAGGPGGGPPGGGPGGGIGGDAVGGPVSPLPWWQRVPVIAGIAGGIVVLLVVIVAVVLGQRSGSGGTTAGGGTTASGGSTAGGTSAGGSTAGGTTGGGGTAGEGGGTGVDVNVGTGVYPDARELALLARLPDEYESSCTRWRGPGDSPLYMHRPLAAIDCAPGGGADRAVFVWYVSDVESEMTFSVVFPRLTGGNCVQNAPMAGTYDQGDGVDAGYFGCLIDEDGTAYVVWTRTGRGVYAFGLSESGDLTSLYDWFLTRAFIE